MCSLTLHMRALGVTCGVNWLSVYHCPPHSLVPFGHVGLAVYAGDAAVTATSRQPTLYQPSGDAYKQTRALVTETGGSPSASR